MKRRIQATLVLLTMNIAVGSAESLAGGMGRKTSHKLAYAGNAESSGKDKSPIRLFNSKRTKAAEEAQKRAALAEEEKRTEKKTKTSKSRKAEKTEKDYAATSKKESKKALYTQSKPEKEAEERKALLTASEEKPAKKKTRSNNSRPEKAAYVKVAKEEQELKKGNRKAAVAKAENNTADEAKPVTKRHTFIANRELRPSKPDNSVIATTTAPATVAATTETSTTVVEEKKADRHVYASTATNTDNSFPAAASAINNRSNVADSKKQENTHKYREDVKPAPADTANATGSSTLSLSPEQENISNGFANNKGHLTWPVANGYISAPYGRYQHPTEKGVMLENNGIDITTSEASPVYSVFSGQVSKIFYVPGRGTTLLINHGNYYTVYSGLVKINVKAGNKVAGHQVIGTVGTNDDGNSILHFEVWYANGNANVGNVNPTQWLAPR